jgi:RNase adaptor protein for sRNA GlmZ degradation
VANKLHKLINYKFFHNHHTHDLSRQLFERGSLHSGRIIENIRLFLFKEIADAKINVVTTHTYSSTFISPTGVADPVYMKKIESIIKKAGGQAYFVHLIADEKEIMKRVSGESRKNFKKLRDKKIMKEILERKNWKIDAPIKNNLVIDNTNLSPVKVSDMIIKYFKLK